MSQDNVIERFIRPRFAGFGGYSAREAPEGLEGEVSVPASAFIKLDANENPYGCSPRVNRALAGYPEFNTYPDACQTELKKLLAGYTGAAPERIVAGSGSGDLIDLLLRLLLEPGDEVITCVPAFSMFPFCTRMYGGRLVELARSRDWAISPEAVRRAVTPRSKIIILDNPNNPTGNLTPESGVRALLDTGLPVLVDEAYTEFAGESVLPLVSRYPNLMVLRTFSKWAGLAGLRVGYGVFPPEIARRLLTIKLPYNVNAAAVVAVRESLADMGYLMANVRAIITERDRLYSELKKLRILVPFPSRANFILCSVRGVRAIELKRRLKQAGILVRYFDTPLLADFIRISVGKPEHTDTLMRALREIEEATNVR